MGFVRPFFKGSAALAVLCLWALCGAEAAPDKRVALVIGNSAYKEAPLKNPVNDARAMAAALRQLGFKVIARENATKQQMERAVGEFGDALASGAIGLFYYAGHGMQVNGRNFLVPVDASITSEVRVRLETLDVDLVLDQMAATGSAVNLVLLDACRNNPFERRFRGAGAGLAQINAPKGTLIAYATAPGKVAADGEGANGVYTEKLLQAMRTPGLPIEEVFKRVRVEVASATQDGQTPWEASSLTGSFYFIEPQAAVVRSGPSEADKEIMFWDSAKSSDDPEVLKSYIARYPKGSFADLARAKLEAAERKQRERAMAPKPISGDHAVWDLVKDLKDPAVFEVFLEKYPNSTLAEAAKLKMAALQKTQKNTQVAAAPAPAPVVAAAPAAPASVPAIPSVPQPNAEEALQLAGPGMPAPTPVSAPAITPAAAPAISTGVDGIWHGTYACGMGPTARAFTSSRYVFTVKNGRLTGRYEAEGVSEEYQGSIAPGGKVAISGSGENMKAHRGGYSISFDGKEEGGRFTAKGRSFGRECTLVYSKIN